ncbi:MAG: protein-L-isoaspartate(D-aspartate) O-methyltransferase [Proteobacteria bacterium]|nr:protein-L-isoaspartate(D-aspartate) O-methyltransferase [Pseudomonadota bacterium]MDE3207981.1 protein-L-isoaspartate(D-aspartate) O-methyltransferase [Pseudomonadota bacterium]
MNQKLTGIGMTSDRTRMRMIERLRQQGITDEIVLTAMREIPRHIFVDNALASRAYEDCPLPIGFAQTISSPYTVARMSELARSGKPIKKVLEIGTGCGYQTAVLSRLAQEVYTVERIGPLLTKARRKLVEIKCSNVRTQHADGSQGFPDMGLFDCILMTAAATHIPQDLLGQLDVGGRMVIPVGTQQQHLYLIERTPQEFKETCLESVKFVPLLPGRS